ncbi:type II toxin-antitoxin system RelE/ParE family toxin (plasmid) [Cereibacter azotoformans]|uniref:type II toxin-antitoxin system RelE/ParE family toxin n=1 Tax=Cereibacter azotoformans TaxID=43057 RepID=UPI000C6E2A61|nr:type II toxin-antitoxin system RelE/ParE family toxin [Cereibacter azotoformans]AXQ96125.1 type II toxin-antitoxin system RelE/ParE family toxin [Cereibacter sphaeroides]UIJ32963.1 type II toxin-antitoxin system RelE/ParE family toxin [Cereibacter azotoformans]ULB12229.1 type II toxin-antitoxin system RelE/ParE family toxin [Cereibacter azotoformans]
MSYRVRFHPAVADDLDAILRWIIDFAGPQVGARRRAEIEAATADLAQTPHKSSLRDEIAPGLRALPAGRKAVIVFTVDDAPREGYHSRPQLCGSRLDGAQQTAKQVGPWRACRPTNGPSSRACGPAPSAGAARRRPWNG